MNSSDPLFGCIGVWVEHLPFSWCQSYQVLLPIWVLQWYKGTNNEDHTQEPSSHLFQVCRVPEKVFHLIWSQTPLKANSHLTQECYQHSQWQHGSIICLFPTNIRSRTPIPTFQLWHLKTKSVVLGYHCSTYKQLSTYSWILVDHDEDGANHPRTKVHMHITLCQFFS